MALLAVVMCVNFSSCSEDNEDENGNPIVNGKRLSTVTIEGSYYNDFFSFSYDKEGRLIRVGGSESFTYSWSENFITITSDGRDDREAKVALNKNGTVKSYDDKWSSFVFQYDSQNYLIKTNETRHDQYRTNIHYFQWDKGNLTKVEEHKSSGESEFEVTQTFDSKMKSNVVMALIRGCDNPYDDSIGRGWNMQLLLATHPNICGNFSKNALHSLCAEGLDTYFEYDKEEYPTKIIEKDSEDDEIQAIYTITWE